MYTVPFRLLLRVDSTPSTYIIFMVYNIVHNMPSNSRISIASPTETRHPNYADFDSELHPTRNIISPPLPTHSAQFPPAPPTPTLRSLFLLFLQLQQLAVAGRRRAATSHVPPPNGDRPHYDAAVLQPMAPFDVRVRPGRRRAVRPRLRRLPTGSMHV